ncbi:hypothetical protein [Variovorax sp.]|uniref:hypothetical protein n=1 Tax=Variovorax sp. TaxID=1871043 RepID=UPI001381384D|nr:hypothetical protein [Variovorax sp.]KAF1069513.1 MAG: hypothetical protein GAK39_02646 [Variovorax sp.]
MHVLHVQTTLLPEAIVLALSLMLASVAAAEVVSGFDAPPPVYDPCHDGRYSQGRAMSCGELLRQLDRRERRLPPWRDERPYGLGEPLRDSG